MIETSSNWAKLTFEINHLKDSNFSWVGYRGLCQDTKFILKNNGEFSDIVKAVME